MTEAATPLPARNAAIYERHEHHILPYIGDAFSAPGERDLRVLTVGVNAYVGEDDWPPKPEWHRAWYEKRAHRFHERVFAETAVLAEAVSAADRFHGLRFEAPRCVCVSGPTQLAR